MTGQQKRLPVGDTPRRLERFKAACAYARCGATKLYELIETGKVVAFKDGRLTLVCLDSIDCHHRSLPRLILNKEKPQS